MKTSLGVVIALVSSIATVQAGSVKVYAAASLSNALTDIAQAYQEQYRSAKIIPVFAASSTLAKQIEAGANADLFFSSDLDWMNYLLQRKVVNSKTITPLLGNELVVISRKNRKIAFAATPNFQFSRSFQGYLCTGNMESVPVGKYAKQSLSQFNWLTSLKGRIVGTQDVRSALAFVERGECEVGIVYKTDALLSQKVKILGTFPTQSHRPIVYPIALTQGGEKNPEAVRFIQFLQHSSQAKAIFHQYGFQLKS